MTKNPSPPVDALVIGDANVDLAWQLPGWPQPGDDCQATGLRWDAGGGGVNAAIMLARLGFRVRLLARLGTDPAGQLLQTRFRTEGLVIDGLQSDPEISTGLCSAAVLPDGERTFFSHRGCNPRLDLEQVPARATADLRLLYVSSHSLLEGGQAGAARALLAQAREAQRFTVLDMGLPMAHRGLKGLTQVLDGLSLLAMNEQEARAMLGEGDADTWFQTLQARGVAAVAIKRGAKGSTLFVQGQRLDLPALSVRSLDTTACGDAFTSGLAWALVEGQTPERGLRLANRLGALTAQRAGSVSALPGQTEAME